MRYGRRLLILGVVAVLLYGAFTAAGGLEAAVHKLRHANTLWLIPAAIAASARYALLGWQIRRVRGSGDQPSFPAAAGLGLITFALGALMPAAPVEGIAVSAGLMKRRKKPVRQSVVMMMASQWFQFWTVIALFAVMLIVVAVIGHVEAWSSGAAAALSFSVLLIVAAADVVTRRERFAQVAADATRWVPGQRRKPREQVKASGVALQADMMAAIGPIPNRIGVGLLTLAELLTDATILWCALHALHAHVAYDIGVFVYSVAILGTLVPFVPSGVGLVELMVPAALFQFGITKSLGLAAILIWRAVSLFGPSLLAILAYLTLRATPRKPGTQETGTPMTTESAATGDVLEPR